MLNKILLGLICGLISLFSYAEEIPLSVQSLVTSPQLIVVKSSSVDEAMVDKIRNSTKSIDAAFVNKLLTSDKYVVSNNNAKYIVSSEVTSISAQELRNHISSINRISVTYNLDVSVIYKVLKASDGTMVATFEADGHTEQTKIINDDTQQINYSVNNLTKQVIANLVGEAYTNFSTKINSN